MTECNKRDPLIERRRHENPQQDLWSELTLAQKFSASSLAKYGYELIFIRCSASGNIAIMQHSENITTIACDGNINTRPDIDTR